MIHFVPPHNDKIRARLTDLIGQVDVVLGNLEDAIPSDAKVAAGQGFIAMAKRQRLRADGAVDPHQCAEFTLGTGRHS